MRRRMSLSVGLLLALGLGGCPTTFSGNAHVVGGRAGCEKMCKKSKLKMSGMVFLGEYSSACICEVPATPEAEKQGDAAQSPAASAGVVGGAVAYMLQTANADETNHTPIYSTRPKEH